MIRPRLLGLALVLLILPGCISFSSTHTRTVSVIFDHRPTGKVTNLQAVLPDGEVYEQNADPGEDHILTWEDQGERLMFRFELTMDGDCPGPKSVEIRYAVDGEKHVHKSEF